MKGFIFRCNNKTKREVFERKLFGEEIAYLDMIRDIGDNYVLFLYNTNTFEISGPFRPASKGDLDIDKYAWGGAFRAQIKFEEIEDTTTIPFAKIEKVIRQYRNNIYPYPLLDNEQVKMILKLIDDF